MILYSFIVCQINGGPFWDSVQNTGCNQWTVPRVSKVIVAYDGKVLFEQRYDKINDIKFLKDTKTIEGFINGGKASFTVWFGK